MGQRCVACGTEIDAARVNGDVDGQGRIRQQSAASNGSWPSADLYSVAVDRVVRPAAKSDGGEPGSNAFLPESEAAGERPKARHRNAWRLRDQIALIGENSAKQHDHGADLHDLWSHVHEMGDADTPDEVIARAQADREKAAADRVQAALDRSRAAKDREHAARERIEAARMLKESVETLKLATTDELTGTWSRKFGLDEAARELQRAHRTGGELVVAFVDVDGLKQVNDSNGHLAGDALLQRTGESLRSSFRTYDLIIRYGGDEFVCVAPNLNSSNARARCDLVRAALAEINTAYSVTYGVAEVRQGDALEQLIERADADLIGARQRSRNTYLSSSDVPRVGLEPRMRAMDDGRSAA